jgi:UDP-N-acetylglucosamine--N-acetylmuramyl-(pentapeptide) pyrophosphoryl-undecaprenol N-acetylglucosamine transferase
VPLPTAAEDHQTLNARALTDRGAAVLVRDDRATTELGGAILALVDAPDERHRLRHAIAGLSLGNAADAIAAEVLRLART